MIRPKYELPPKQSKADRTDHYELATLRDGNRCLFRAPECVGAAQRDHRQNRTAFNTVTSNLQLLCLVHHQWKSEHPEDALAEGWAVPSWADPAEWPARRWVDVGYGVLRLVWCLYDDEGGIRVISEAEAFRPMYGEAG